MKAQAIDIMRELDKDLIRQNLRRFTWQAYNLLPPLERPLILDLGCGTGAAAIELAVLSKGHVTAVDRDRAALARLREKAAALALRGNVRVVAGDILAFRAKRESFDIIWSEGAVAAVGFERALAAWRDLLKPDGRLVIHDEIRDRERKLASLEGLGYRVASTFVIPVDIWLTEYFRPLGQRIYDLAAKYAERPDLLAVLREEEAEIEVFKSRPDDFASVFYILQKTQPRRIE
jgi:SAM-dependent methyltransferase